MSRHRVLFCGGRDFEDEDLVCKTLRSIPRDSIVVTGDCLTGADRLVINSARLMNKRAGFNFWTWACAADWHEDGKAAGPIRNTDMLLEVTGVDEVIAFPGGRGTDDMCARAQQRGIRVTRVGLDG